MQSGLDTHIYFLHQLVRINVLFLIEYPCKGNLDVFSAGFPGERMDVSVAGLHKSSLKTEARLMVERSGGWCCWVPAFLAPSRKQSWAYDSRYERLHAGRALEG